MEILSAACMGTALAADAMAASFSRGLDHNDNTTSEALKTALCFGFFQMAMPVLGWSIGKVGGRMIAGAGNWVAFSILLFLGIKMLADSISQKKEVNSGVGLLMLAFATSIDALASGLTLPVAAGVCTPLSLLLCVGIIGFITFLLSLAGSYFGRSLSRFSPGAAGIAGGIMLILLAIKTVIR